MNIMGMVLPLIGNFQLKNAKKVIAENLKISKSMEPYMGTGSSPLASVAMKLVQGAMTGGMGQLVQNPVGALTGAVAGAIPGMSTVLNGSSASGVGALQQAMTGPLTTALNALGGHTAAMTGMAQASDTSFGPSQVLGHAALLSSGYDMPAGIGMDQVLAPLGASGLVAAIQTNLPALVASVAAGGDAGAATAQVQAWAATLNGLVNGSVAALQGGQAKMVDLSNASTVVDEMMAPANPLAAAFISLIAQPGVMGPVQPVSPGT